MRDTFNFLMELTLVFVGILSVYLLMCEMNDTNPPKQKTTVEEINGK